MTRVPGWKPALLIVGVYLTLAFSIVAAGGFRAQDYDAHIGFLERGLTGGWYLKGLTNPPLLYLFAAAMIRLVGWGSALSVVSATFALLNAASLVILWRCAARVLTLRGSLLVTSWIATLPAFVTTAVVFASDALVILPFTLFCYLNLRLLESIRPSAALLVASPIAQVAGCLSKYAFIGVAPAAFVMAGVLAFKHRHRPALAAAAAMCVFAIPTAANVLVMDRLDANAGHNLTFPEPSGVMTFRSLLWPYAHDVDLLAAPMYFDPIEVAGSQIRVGPDGRPDPDGRPGYELLVNNRYSYPGLLNLALNSDLMNITRRRLAGDNAFTMSGPRRPVNQFFQQASVLIGALLALIGLASMAAVAASWLRTRILPAPNALNFTIGVLLPALMFVGLIVVMLPFVGYETYYGGFWLPRFIVAGLLVFGIAGAWAASTVVRAHWPRQFLVGLVVTKVGVQLAIYL
jgi:hypothetical protein